MLLLRALRTLYAKLLHFFFKLHLHGCKIAELMSILVEKVVVRFSFAFNGYSPLHYVVITIQLSRSAFASAFLDYKNRRTQKCLIN